MTLSDVMYMQDLTSEICKSSTENETRIMADNRDWKTYWVTKLKDGNCWMTQNLDYNDPNATRYTAPNQPNSWPGSNDDTARYYDPGDYYYANTSSWSSCSGIADGLTNSSCTSNGWSTNGDSHYHVGNYYNWNSATNGSGKSATTNGAIASDSICPNGWKLPTGNNTASGSFGGLTTAYGIGNDASGATKLRNSPLYFIPGGFVGSGYLYNAGSEGFYWSSTALYSTNAYRLYFDSSSVNPSGDNARYVGASVRCLMQGS